MQPYNQFVNNSKKLYFCVFINIKEENNINPPSESLLFAVCMNDKCTVA